jgi:hypothetical protein
MFTAIMAIIAVCSGCMLVATMTEIEDFSRDGQDEIKRLLKRPFPDALPALESYFGQFGALTRDQVLFFERLWAQYGPSTPEIDIWNALKGVNEREKVAERPSPRREVVVRKGHRVVIWRDPVTGRFVRRRRRRKR